ncbi:hypothetical protein MMC19_004206 [Ptychographa xylographoides]|nr:hypothetical protein [Ptychographa xylographoides]
MAADTREPSRHADASQPSIFRKLDKNVSSVPESSTSTATGRPYRGETYETFASSPTPRSEEASLTSSKSIELGPPENANVLPGGSVNTAGGRAKEATFWDGIKSIKMQDVKDLHKIPCVRDALLVGIGGGFFIGGGRMVSGATMWKSMSWAMGTFCFSSAGMYEFCQRRRFLERQGMLRAAEIIDRKRLEKERQAERTRAERRRKREEDEIAREEEEKRKNSGWSFWGRG